MRRKIKLIIKQESVGVEIRIHVQRILVPLGWYRVKWRRAVTISGSVENVDRSATIDPPSAGPPWINFA